MCGPEEYTPEGSSDLKRQVAIFIGRRDLLA
jgi:hypothetical protein